jgi:uncharacterized protein YndB with AHSA1/START domain
MSSESRFVYVTYIRTTPEKLWAALTDPAWMRQYWLGAHAESAWTPGASWRLVFDDGRLADAGEILESDPPKRLVIKWRNEWKAELTAEGWSRCVMELSPEQDSVRLSVTHSIDRPESALIGAVSNGWPKILSNLKSLLETGEVVFAAR